MIFPVPRADRDLAAWMQATADHLARDPARYMLTAEQIALLTTPLAAFRQALTAPRNRPATTTASTSTSASTTSTTSTSAKNRAREAARAAFRPIIDHIKHHAEIDLADKLALGMKASVRRPRTPIQPPDSTPLLTIIAIGDGTHTLRFADSNTPHITRKPHGGQMIEIRIIIVADTTPGSPGSSEIPGSSLPQSPDDFDTAESRTEFASRSPHTIEHARAHAGQTAIYYARWMTQTGKPGPWSTPIWTTIACTGGGGAGGQSVEDHR